MNFIFNIHNKNEQKRFNTEYTQLTNEVKKQRQLDLVNSKLPAGLEKANGPPPVRGAVFEMGGWIMPKLKRPDLTKQSDQESRADIGPNALDEKTLKEIRNKIYEQNTSVASGKFSKVSHPSSFSYIILIQVHNRN